MNKYEKKEAKLSLLLVAKGAKVSWCKPEICQKFFWVS